MTFTAYYSTLANALEIAKWLSDHPLVDHVRHPAFETCPGHEIWQRDFQGANGLFSIVMKSGHQKAVQAMIEGLTHFKMGFSWGGYESLVTATMNVQSLRSATTWPYQGPLIRFHIGLESVEDLKVDLAAGLERYQAAL